MVLIVVLVVATALAVTSVAIGNNGNVHPQKPGVLVAVIGTPGPQTTSTVACPAFGNSAYTATPTAISWPDTASLNLTQAGPGETVQICEEETGGSTDTTPGVTSATGISAGSCQIGRAHV